jgi:protein ImuB
LASSAQAQADADADAVLLDPVTALAWCALQFTPRVARLEASLVLEVSGSARLFGGAAALLQALLDASRRCLPVDYALGSTALVAWGRLQAGLPQAEPAALPLHVLAAARPHLPTLLRLGCRNWGQLRALPRAGLARRFGAELVDALDQAFGACAQSYPWLTLPQRFEASLELSAAVESAPALLFGARRLLAQLQAWLRARQHGVLALELLWDLDARRANALHVDAHHNGSSQGRLVLRTAQPTQDMLHLQRILAEQLAPVRLPAPVLYLHLRTLQTQALAGESLSLLPQDMRKGHSRHQMLERLVARLGPDSVLCVQPQADHRPERMQQWQPWSAAAAMGASPRAPACEVPAVPYPTWLLARPQALELQQGSPCYHGPLTLLLGPQRLETGWLEGVPALRDYFVARSAQAGLLWIYRERLGPQRAHWYLHGLFA